MGFWQSDATDRYVPLLPPTVRTLTDAPSPGERGRRLLPVPRRRVRPDDPRRRRAVLREAVRVRRRPRRRSSSSAQGIDGRPSTATPCRPNGERVEVAAGQQIELVVTADAPGEIHVHSSPEQELEYDAGTTTLELSDRPARHRRRRVARRWRRRSSSSKSAEVSPDGDLARPRHRRRQGPADLARAGDRRRDRRPGRLVHGPRGRLAHPAVRRRDQRPPGPGLAGPRRRRPGVPAGAARGRLVLLAYAAVAAVLGKDLLTNPLFGMFYVWWWVGLVPLSLLLGPVWKAISPVRTINLALREDLRQRPRARASSPTPSGSGHWPAAARPVRVRLDRAGLPLRQPSSARCGCGARRTSR